MPSILSALLYLVQLWRAGGDRRRAWDAHSQPPVHRNVRAQAAGGTRDPDGERMSPGFRWPISHFQGCVCARGQRTLQVSLPRAPGSPCLTSVSGNQWGRRWGHWDPRVMMVKPGRAPELSWGEWSGQLLRLSL